MVKWFLYARMQQGSIGAGTLNCVQATSIGYEIYTIAGSLKSVDIVRVNRWCSMQVIVTMHGSDSETLIWMPIWLDCMEHGIKIECWRHCIRRLAWGGS